MVTRPAHPIATASTKLSNYPALFDAAVKHLAPPVIVTTSGTADLSGSDFFVLDATAGDVALALPDPASDENAARRQVTVVRTPGGDKNSATVAVNGDPGVAIAEGASISWVSDETRWYRA